MHDGHTHIDLRHFSFTKLNLNVIRFNIPKLKLEG